MRILEIFKCVYIFFYNVLVSGFVESSKVYLGGMGLVYFLSDLFIFLYLFRLCIGMWF